MRPHPGEGNEDKRLPHKGRPHISGRTHWNKKGPSGAIKRKCSGWSVAGRTEQDLHGWSVPQALHAPAWDGCPPVQMGAGCWSVGLGEWIWIEDNCWLLRDDLKGQKWEQLCEDSLRGWGEALLSQEIPGGNVDWLGSEVSLLSGAQRVGLPLWLLFPHASPCLCGNWEAFPIEQVCVPQS